MFSYIDIHSHIQFPQFDDDRDEVVARAREAGVAMINVGTNVESSQAAIDVAREFGEGLYATAGLHPTHTDPSAGREVERFDAAIYRELASQKEVVAIGECGLDYYRLNDESKKVQAENFEAQIELAIQLDKPLMLHIRNPLRRSDSEASAYEDAHAILERFAKGKGLPSQPGDVHFFAGNWEEAKLFLDLGFTISFTGVVTFTGDYDEVVKKAPLERLMVETDCPYVAPVPHRGKRNEPAFVVETARRIAAIRGEDEETVRGALAENARRVFAL